MEQRGRRRSADLACLCCLPASPPLCSCSPRGLQDRSPGTPPQDPAQIDSAIPGTQGHTIIVGFRYDTSAGDRDALRQSLGGELVDTLFLPRAGVRAELIEVASGQTVSTAISEYEASPLVLYAEPNGSNPLAAVPNDGFFANEWGLNNTGQTVNGQTGMRNADIDAPEAWDTTTGSPSRRRRGGRHGNQYDHADLAAQIWNNPGEAGGGKETNAVDDDGNGYVDDWRGWDWVNGSSGTAGSSDNDPRDTTDTGRTSPARSVRGERRLRGTGVN